MLCSLLECLKSSVVCLLESWFAFIVDGCHLVVWILSVRYKYKSVSRIFLSASESLPLRPSESDMSLSISARDKQTHVTPTQRNCKVLCPPSCFVADHRALQRWHVCDMTTVSAWVWLFFFSLPPPISGISGVFFCYSTLVRPNSEPIV